MKNLIILLLVIIIIFIGVFKVNEVYVFDIQLNSPIPYVLVNKSYYTNEEGKTKFLDFTFRDSLSFERIGYKTTTLKIGFKLFTQKIDVSLEEADSQYIKEQISNWLNTIKNYKYELVTDNGSQIYTFIQAIDRKNIYTKTETLDKAKNVSNVEEIYVVNDKVYVKQNNEPLKEITENKDDFISSNLVLIPLQDVVTDFFSNVNGKVDFKSPSEFVFKNGNSNLTLTLGKNGDLEKLLLESSQPNYVRSSLTIYTRDVRVDINEQG